jgi:hypothetical protein
MENKITKIVGTIYHIAPTQRISDKFQKREFVIQTTDEKFSQLLLLQLTNDKCNSIDNLKFGEMVECCYNLRGREWISPQTGEKKWFNTIECWSIQFASVHAKNDFMDRTQSEMATKQPSAIENARTEQPKRSLDDLFDNEPPF